MICTCPTCDSRVEMLGPDEDGWTAPDTLACAEPGCTVAICAACVDDEDLVRRCEECKRPFHVEHLVKQGAGDYEMCHACIVAEARREDAIQSPRGRRAGPRPPWRQL
jgi:hypothetical protein